MWAWAAQWSLLKLTTFTFAQVLLKWDCGRQKPYFVFNLVSIVSLNTYLSHLVHYFLRVLRGRNSVSHREKILGLHPLSILERITPIPWKPCDPNCEITYITLILVSSLCIKPLRRWRRVGQRFWFVNLNGLFVKDPYKKKYRVLMWII